MRNSTRLRALVGGSFAATGIITIGAGLALAAGTTTASAAGGVDKKDYVCKYVGATGVDERLQAGNNPIWVATDFPAGAVFNDAHGRSFVLIADTPRLNPEPDPSACPDLNVGPVDETEPADPETVPVDETEPADPETVPVDETEPADPETVPVDETEPADPETVPVDETEPADDETEGAAVPESGTLPDSGTVPTEPTDLSSPVSGEADPDGFNQPIPGDTTTSSAPRQHNTHIAHAAAVPTAVQAGLGGPTAGDQSPLAGLLTVLGALIAAGGAAVAVTGRVRGAHQL